MAAQQLIRFKQRWQQLLYVEGVLYALGAAGLVYLALHSLGYGLLAFVLAMIIYVVVRKPWKISLDNTIAYVDAYVPQAGFSSGLLTVPQEQLNNLSKLQRYRVETALQPVFATLRPPQNLKNAAIVFVALVLTGLAARLVIEDMAAKKEGSGRPQEITFAPVDSVETGVKAPTLIYTQIKVVQPSYTGIPNRTTKDPNIKAVQGSQIAWQLQFEGEVLEVRLDRMGGISAFSKTTNGYALTQKLESSAFYSISYKDENGNSYVTDLYSMEAIKDEAPFVGLEGLDQYNYFDFDDDKKLFLDTRIADDFGISDAYIVATVSKGSGESVKFREETVRFEESFSKGKKQLQLNKTLDLDQLRMDPGDELYFYVEAIDNKMPSSNISRSETYFAVIRDTVSDTFGVEGTLGVDLMPDYFRSQRQLIIDTEKLIKDKPKLSEYDFKFTSNELGFDQKSLRLKYGQFMGDETEMQAAPGQVSSTEEDHADEGGEEDLLEGYSHRHDSDNEHNLVEEHDEEAEGEEAEDPLHDYLHNHEDPEASTLFEKSLKAKLRDALNIMWDAELYLRLYQPEKSLPYQYEALKLIQEIKNSARIYVHRIGFDPPPIKEEKRLTGDIKSISNFDKKETFDYELSFQSTRQTVARLEQLIQEQSSITNQDQILFQEAGNELAAQAVDNPLKYVKVLQGLRDLSKVSHQNVEHYRLVRKNVLAVLPMVENNPGHVPQYQDEINKLYLKALEAND
jgi:hypothetical protein